MSLLTPERVPVKVYKWDDADAPVLDKSVGCIGTILKACLVTGYGTKESAGWTLTHEDTASKTKILGFDDMTGLPVSLRLKSEDANTMGVQLVKDVVSANDATVIIECETRFKFFGSKLTGEWTVIASEKGFWFFAQILHQHAPANETGVFLFAGTVPGMLSSAFVIKHTGGTFADTDADRFGVAYAGNGKDATTPAVAYRLDNGSKIKDNFDTMWNSTDNKTPNPLVAPLYLYGAGDVYQMPLLSPSRADYLNFANAGANVNAMNFCTSTQYIVARDNVYIPTDSWGV
ncbi:hypothetical protein [uncultured Psychrobacter sp.]|uniref:hypothetical protein n=1 Tax=uncultured Psychrobacter sp. TaxID=259303 RepID=UPI000E919E8F|nr:hypothetical protein [Psychrobacter sp.]|tara:strand:+ start:31994 stop:32860 length:867 start_codon:yes stop_codon:yes gene_type:complete